jgi:hypothetical protein
MIVALEGGAGAGVIKGDFIDRSAGDNEADVGKGLCGIVGAGRDVRIAEVGAGLVRSTVAGCDCTGSIIQER